MTARCETKLLDDCSAEREQRFKVEKWQICVDGKKNTQG